MNVTTGPKVYLVRLVEIHAMQYTQATIILLDKVYY